MRKILPILLSTLVLLVISTSFVYGQAGGTGGTGAGGSGGNQPSTITLDNPLKPGLGNSIPELMKAIINNLVLPIGGAIAILAFIWAGFKYVLARGNEAKVAEAHKALLYTAVGTAILLGASVIIDILNGTLGQLLSNK